MYVDNTELQSFVEKALKLGAKLAGSQYRDGEWITLLDPAGRPFCFVM